MSQYPSLPPLYVEPVALNAERHAGWRLLAGDVAVAGETAVLPITAGEFGAACGAYPILFTTGGGPIALMGLDRANLFVEGGRWAPGAYVPAYVRRYPFLLIETADKRGFALGLDAGSPRVARDGEAGVALFEDGAPSEITRQALEFCGLFNGDHQRTLGFCAALADAGLLVDRRADATLPGGRRLGVQGFKVVDTERFAALDDAVVVDWHRKGWLGLIHFHLASLQRFNDLVGRQGAQPSPADLPDLLPPTSPRAARRVIAKERPDHVS